MRLFLFSRNDDCLSEPANTYSHKPTKYVEKEKKNENSCGSYDGE